MVQEHQNRPQTEVLVLDQGPSDSTYVGTNIAVTARLWICWGLRLFFVLRSRERTCP